MEDIDTHIQLSKSEYKTVGHVSTNAAHLKWKFCDAPYGPMVATMMLLDQKLIGRSMRHSRPFLLNSSGKQIIGTSIFDVLVAPKNRNALTSIEIIKAGTNLHNTDLILHGSNQYSFPIYSNFFKYPIVFSLTAKGVPIRPANLLNKLFGFGPKILDSISSPLRWAIRGISKCCSALSGLKLMNEPLTNSELADLHERSKILAGPHFLRDVEFTKWRYDTGPIFNARLTKIVLGTELIGYVALKATSFEGVNLGLIVDVQITQKLNFSQRLAFNFGVVSDLLNEKPDAVVILANFYNDTLKHLIGFPFLTVPDKYLPHPNPIFAICKENSPDLLEKLRKTHYTLADLDYF